MTTLIFAAVVVLWLAYLVPWFTTRHQDDPAQEVETAERMGESMSADSVRLVRRSADWDAEDPDLDVSTPFTRKAAYREIQQTARLATVRRRRLMVGTLLATVLVGVLTPLLAVLPWWSALVPGALAVASVFICRFSTRTMDAALAERLAQLRARWENETITLALPEAAEPVDPAQVEYSIELTAPIEMTGSLWEPIPVIAPSYVTKPLVPRTVRTIDLSAPAAPLSVPPLAEAPASETAATSADAAERPRAVGE